jgi:hypothetical protein
MSSYPVNQLWTNHAKPNNDSTLQFGDGGAFLSVMDGHQGMSSEGWCIQRETTPPGKKSETL